MISEPTLAKTPKRPTRILAIDFGLARLGIAISDERKIIVSPLTTFKASKRSEETTQSLIAELKKHATANRYDIEEVIIGLPLMMSGKKGHLADEVLHFVELWKKECDIPILTWDERLTSVQADRSLRESDMSRKKRSQAVDAVAAMIILQSYLEHRRIREERLAN